MAAVGAASDQHEKGGLSGGNRSTVATDSPKCHIEITVRLSSAHRPAPRRPGVASANMSAMPHFTRAELEACRGRVVPDLIAPGLRLLFVGINPGLWTAATQTHFAHPGNRFYPALLRAGIIERPIDPAAGMSDADREYLIGRWASAWRCDLPTMSVPRIVVRRSPIHGRGVFANVDLSAHVRVLEYRGERIDSAEAFRRYGDNSRLGETYLFAVNAHWLIDGNVGGSS